MKLEGKRFSRIETTRVVWIGAFALVALAASTAGCATPTQQTNLTSADKAVETTAATRPAPRVGKSQRAEHGEHGEHDEMGKPVQGQDLRQGLESATDDDLDPKRMTTNDVSSSHRRSGTFGAWK